MSLAALKSAVQAGQYQTARWLFVQVLDDPSLSRGDMAAAYCEASVAEYRAGHLHTAIAWSKMAAGLASEMGQVQLLSRVSQNLIEFLRLSGETAAAIDTGLRWLASYADNPEVAFRTGRIYYNLALTYRQREETDKALTFYEKAWQHLEQVHKTHPDPAERERSVVAEVMSLQNAAWLLYEVGRNKQADEVVRKAKALLPVGDRVLALEQDLLDALRAHKAGDAEAVLAMVRRAFSSATSIPELQLFWLYWLAAHALLQQGKPGIASAYATMATQAAEDTKNGRLIGLAHDLEKETIVVSSKS
ncbi:MAG TPA: hypothetical protein VNT75_07930 [Symbiobacteriaceae bacterium]|nr:hypothetical protein [Symbiobacteriaceae bacterium]